MGDLFGAGPRSNIRDRDKLRELEREIAMRERVYPRWVQAGKMKSIVAVHRLEVLRAIADDYKARVAAPATKPRTTDGNEKEKGP